MQAWSDRLFPVAVSIVRWLRLLATAGRSRKGNGWVGGAGVGGDLCHLHVSIRLSFVATDYEGLSRYRTLAKSGRGDGGPAVRGGEGDGGFVWDAAPTLRVPGLDDYAWLLLGAAVDGVEKSYRGMECRYRAHSIGGAGRVLRSEVHRQGYADDGATSVHAVAVVAYGAGAGRSTRAGLAGSRDGAGRGGALDGGAVDGVDC